MHAFLDIAFKLLNQRNPKLVDGQRFLVYWFSHSSGNWSDIRGQYWPQYWHHSVIPTQGFTHCWDVIYSGTSAQVKIWPARSMELLITMYLISTWKKKNRNSSSPHIQMWRPLTRQIDHYVHRCDGNIQKKNPQKCLPEIISPGHVQKQMLHNAQ